MERLIKYEREEKRIRNGYILAFLLLFLSYFLTTYTNRELNKQSVWVDHSNQVINGMEKMLSAVKDGETGVRGYFLTKNIEFLTPYYGSREMTDSIFKSVEKLTVDNPSQQERLGRLKRQIDRRFDILQFSLKSFSAKNELTDSMMHLQKEAIETMKDVRMTVAMMQREEKQLLTSRDKKMEKTFASLKIINIVSIIIAFSLLAFGFITYFRESAGRKDALQKIKEYQDKLNNQIAELNKANEQLVEMRSQEKFAATGRIARTIAHEVRNPLTNINLAVEQLKADVPETDDDSLMFFTMINRNCNRINQLISDLLNSTKFIELNAEKVSVNDLLDSTLKEAEDRILLNKINVVKKYSPDICNVKVDKTQIKIAFLNIIINAIEAMTNRDKSILTIETKGENGRCKIIISDNGPGIDEELQSRLFEPYFTSKQKGNGLGLTNTQNIILNHKGSINVKSKINQGTTFIITLDFAQ